MQHIRLTFLPFIFILFIPFNLFSQSHVHGLPCGTDLMVEKSLQNNPSLIYEMEELERFTQENEGSSESRADIRIVPIVFHVIHNYGPENITREQVLDAVRIINEDFKLLNEDQNEVVSAFTSIIGNPEIEFRLARRDPSGQCTEGITRTVSTLTYNADDNVKELISWPSNRYLNVWIVDKISFNAGGYAYLPGSAPSAADDGIVVLHRQLGSIGTSGGGNFAARTLTHEIGHWFNLRHTWGPSNSPGESGNCNQDDGVTDTPNTLGVANQSCNLSQNTCSSLDNVQNYMDYSTCALMFTAGQSNRMNSALSSGVGGRSNLWTNSNLTFTGVNSDQGLCVPLADFISNVNSTCEGLSIQFSDLSYNSPFDNSWGWNWNFPGGQPSSSNLQNPVVSYPTAGIYPVTLSVTNSAGANSKTKTDFIRIRPNIGQAVAPVVEGFENQNFPNNTGNVNQNWSIEAPANAFQRSTSASASGSGSLQYRNSSIVTGEISSVLSPVINLENVSTPASLTFKVAYARRSSGTNDKLEVYGSTDCGRTWQRRFIKSGTSLATTTQNIIGNFIPNADQWRTESINLAVYAGNPKVMFRFAVTDSGGNNLYLDDINIVNELVGTNDVSFESSSVHLFPNPSDGSLTQLNFTLLRAEPVQIFIRDLAGRDIASKSLGKLTSGEHIISLGELVESQARGVYLVELIAGPYRHAVRWAIH